MISIRSPLLVLGTLLAALLIVVGVTSPTGYAVIEDFSVNVPTQDVIRDYCLGVLWGTILGLSILVWPVPRQHKRWLATAWGVKSFTAMVLMLPYEQRYGGLDCWTYFRDAHTSLLTALQRISLGSGDFIIALGTVHLTIGPDSYHAMKLTFALIGLIGVYFFYRSAEILLGRSSICAFWGLQLYPSVLFWSTILGKDPVVLLGIALHTWGLLKVTVDNEHKHLWTVLFGAVLASVVRVWMGPILLGPAFVLLLLKQRSAAWRLVSVAVVSTALAIAIPASAERLKVGRATDIIEASQILSRDRANSSLTLDVEMNTTWDIAQFIPTSMFIAYFRPLPGDLDHALGNLAGMENAVLLAAAVVASLRLRPRHFRNPIFTWASILILTWGAAYGLVAYRDLGTAVRFKLQIVPVFLGVLCFLILGKKVRSTTSKT